MKAIIAFLCLLGVSLGLLVGVLLCFVLVNQRVHPDMYWQFSLPGKRRTHN